MSSATTSSTRCFWKTHDPESQWHPSVFTVDGVTYANAEQYMMASKARLFGDAVTEAKILKTTNARTMKDLGRKVTPFDNDVWMANCYHIVTVGNYAKFAQNPSLRQHLLDTGDRELIEASPVDRLYGIGYSEGDVPADRSKWGMNYLGKICMDIRNRLRQESAELSAVQSLLSANTPK